MFACDHFVDWPHHLGDVNQRSLAEMVDGEAQARFALDKSEQLPRVCRECPHLKVCWGGCPKDRLFDAPDGDGKLNYLCAGYAAFFAHAAPVMRKMAQCLRESRPASDWQQIA